MEKQLTNKSPSGRTRRTPLSKRNRLSVKNQEQGFVYRIVNDTDDRIELFQDAGYELVPDAQVGDKRVGNAKSLGSTNSVSVGSGTQAFVMRIKKEWYDEDQAAKQARVDELEQTTQRDAKKHADYGSIKISTGRE